MLKTNLKHLETEEKVREVLENNQNVMICCGRMGPMCIPVYAIMESLESNYPDVAFRDQDFDGPSGGCHLPFISRMEESWLLHPAFRQNSKS